MNAEEVYALLNKKIKKGGITDDQIKQSVEQYLWKNPVQVITDNTLSVAGTPADALATGTAIDELKGDLVDLRPFANSLILNWIDGKYINFTDGTLNTNDIWSATDFIKLNPFTTYKSNINGYWAIYNSNKEFVRGGQNVLNHITNNDDMYLRFSIETSKKSDITIECSNNTITNIKERISFLYSYNIGVLNDNILLHYKCYVDNKYINLDGVVANSSSYCYTGEKIPVRPYMTCNVKVRYECFVAYYNLDGSHIKSILLSGKEVYNITIPANCYYVALSLSKADKELISFSYINNEKKNPFNLIIVDKNGNGDFTTINSALSYAYTIESVDNPITIYINPGVYEEVLFIKGQHYVSLIGKNRNDCIIKDETALYNNAPLRIQGQCYVANLSIISTANKYTSPTGTGKNAWVTDVLNGVKNPEWLGTIGSYAVHCDDATNGEHTVSRFENCYMYSETFPAFGGGMQLDNTIELIGCELITNIDEDVFNARKGNMQGTLLVHGNFPSEPVSEPKQKLFVKDCYIEGVNSRCVNMYPSENAPKASIIFINNTFMNNHCASLDDLVVFTFDTQYIENCSNGNNLDFFNRTLLESNI